MQQNREASYVNVPKVLSTKTICSQVFTTAPGPMYSAQLLDSFGDEDVYTLPDPVATSASGKGDTTYCNLTSMTNSPSSSLGSKTTSMVTPNKKTVKLAIVPSVGKNPVPSPKPARNTCELYIMMI